MGAEEKPAIQGGPVQCSEVVEAVGPVRPDTSCGGTAASTFPISPILIATLGHGESPFYQ